jgi:hypothetical protein
MNAFVVSRLIKHRAKLRAGARALPMPPGSLARPLTSSGIALELCRSGALSEGRGPF